MSKQSRPAQDAVPAPPAQVIPIIEEQALVLKRKTLTEGVRVRTKVREDEALIDEPVVRETVEVERVPLDRWVDGPVPVRQEGDTTIVTLLEEVMVVEKRLHATEEIRITRRRETESLSTAALERLFWIGFALDLFRRDMDELTQRAKEISAARRLREGGPFTRVQAR